MDWQSEINNFTQKKASEQREKRARRQQVEDTRKKRATEILNNFGAPKMLEGIRDDIWKVGQVRTEDGVSELFVYWYFYDPGSAGWEDYTEYGSSTRGSRPEGIFKIERKLTITCQVARVFQPIIVVEGKSRVAPATRETIYVNLDNETRKKNSAFRTDSKSDYVSDVERFAEEHPITYAPETEEKIKGVLIADCILRKKTRYSRSQGEVPYTPKIYEDLKRAMAMLGEKPSLSGKNIRDYLDKNPFNLNLGGLQT